MSSATVLISALRFNKVAYIGAYLVIFSNFAS